MPDLTPLSAALCVLCPFLNAPRKLKFAPQYSKPCAACISLTLLKSIVRSTTLPRKQDGGAMIIFDRTPK